MSCDPAALESFVVGEFSASASAQVLAHARSCAACAEEIQWLRREHAAVVSHAREPAIALPAFEAVLRQSQEVEAPPPMLRPPARRSWVAGLATAAALVIALGSSLHLMPTNTSHPSAAWVSEGEEVASAEASISVDTSADEAIASEEDSYEACLWASPGAPVVDACL